MEEKERSHVLKVLEDAKKAVGEQDILKLKELSNQTIHSASIFQDTDSIVIAVVIYSLSKIIQRRANENFKGCDVFCQRSLVSIDKAIEALKKDDSKEFSDSLAVMNNSVNKLSGNLRRYVSDVFAKAKINKASKIYEHGISMEQTAELLGITMYELASYTGQSEISENDLNQTQSVKARVKIAMEMFS